jgi:hypothetical protein
LLNDCLYFSISAVIFLGQALIPSAGQANQSNFDWKNMCNNLKTSMQVGDPCEILVSPDGNLTDLGKSVLPCMLTSELGKLFGLTDNETSLLVSAGNCIDVKIDRDMAINPFPDFPNGYR